MADDRRSSNPNATTREALLPTSEAGPSQQASTPGARQRDQRVESTAVFLLDWVVILLTGWSIVPVLVVAFTRDLGPVGIGLLLPLACGILALPYGIMRLVLTRARRRSPMSSGRLALAASGLFVLCVIAVLVARGVTRAQELQAQQQTIAALDQQAWTCARAAAREYPDEAETNGGVEIRPRMTAATNSCVEQLWTDWHLTCTGRRCQASSPLDRRSRVLVVLLDAYMDAALQELGAGRWHRSSPAGHRLPDPPWVRPIRGASR